MYIEESFENNNKFTVNLSVNLKKYSGSLNLLSLTSDNKAFITSINKSSLKSELFTEDSSESLFVKMIVSFNEITIKYKAKFNKTLNQLVYAENSSLFEIKGLDDSKFESVNDFAFKGGGRMVNILSMIEGAIIDSVINTFDDKYLNWIFWMNNLVKKTRILVLLFYHLKLDFVDVFKDN